MMKKLAKALSLSLVLALLLSTSAFAALVELGATPQIDKENRTAVVSGMVSDPAVNQQVAIMVLKGQKTLANMTDDDIVFLDQTVPAQDGAFSFAMKIKAEHGDKFNVFVGGTEVASVCKTVLNFGSSKPGDVNDDGFVDLEDYNIIILNYNKKPFDSRADLNNDGYVDIEDYNIVIVNYNK